jgi:dTDP-3-amino-2,3,6-trideoxy-4-keto-D-glucose/dTDP-3-amino-3,4,6-trideoxy-alpha-D-glucose/dTDP-2,6-dideoxy-D-kanosamine transaminase
MNEIRVFDYLEQYNNLRSQIITAVNEVFNSGQLILGEQTNKFEKDFASFLSDDSGYAVGVNSGTDAIAIALMACGVGPGDEVVTVANTAVPTVSAIRMAGAIPVFCDVDQSTALMDLNKIEKYLTSKTKAIVPVHLFGNVVDIDYLKNLVSGKNIFIVEDCAQAHGSTLNGRMVGTLGYASAFSFYPTKNLGAFGDAGLCYSADQEIANEMRRIRMYGFDNASYAEREGINSRMDEIQAAILNVKLPYLDDNITKRRSLADYYNKHLDPSILRFSASTAVKHSYHLFVVRVHKRDHIRKTLLEHGVSTGVHYPFPIHRMRGYEFLGYQQDDLPITESLSNEVLSLPMYPELSLNSVERVCEVLNTIIKNTI